MNKSADDSKNKKESKVTKIDRQTAEIVFKMQEVLLERYAIKGDKFNDVVAELVDDINEDTGIPAKTLRTLANKCKTIANKMKIQLEKSSYEKIGDYHIFRAKDGEKDVISEETLNKIHKDYAGFRKKQQIEIMNEYGISDVMWKAIKDKFNLTHKSHPVSPDTMNSRSYEDLAEEIVDEQFASFGEVLEKKEKQALVRELKKYMEAEYWYDKVIDALIKAPKEKMNYEVKTVESDDNIDRGAIGIITDWHVGLKVDNVWNKVDIDTIRDRVHKLKNDTIEAIRLHKTKEYHAIILGDLINGIIHTTTRLSNEVGVDKQGIIVKQLLVDFLKGIAEEVEVVHVHSTYGNHGRIIQNKKEALDGENLENVIMAFVEEGLSDCTNIEFKSNVIDEQIIAAKIRGNVYFGVHGDKDKANQSAKVLTTMIGLKPTAIFSGDKHHMEGKEEHKVDVFGVRSLSGVDKYAKDIRKTSKPGQDLFIVSDKGIENHYLFTYDNGREKEALALI